MSLLRQSGDGILLSSAAGRKIPAWLLSLALHLTALLAGNLLVRTTYLSPKQEESLRRTSIVLARSTAQVPLYFQEEDAASSNLAHDAAAAALPPSAALDAVSAAPPASAIALPEAPGSAPSTGALVIRPDAGRGRGSLSGLTAVDVAAIMAEDAARPREAAPTGPTARLSLFGSAEAEGRSFVFLIDRSQSMGHEGLGAIAAAAKELAASIDRLGVEQKFAVITYNQKPLSLAGSKWIAATPENKRRLIEFVERTVAVGATEHERGLYAALRLKPEVIFLFTDGGDPELGGGQLRALQAAAADRTAIHCLHFGAGPRSGGENFLEKLAAQNGGSYTYVDMRQRD